MKQNLQHRNVVILSCLIAILTGIISGNALAGEVYSWTDANGVVHFGDRPPEGQESRTIIIPESTSSGVARTGESPQSASALNDGIVPGVPGEEEAPPLSLADQKRDQMAKDRNKKRKKTEEMESMCAQHRQRLTKMEPSRRVFYTDESGQTVRMDDEERVSLVKEDKEFIAKNCK